MNLIHTFSYLYKKTIVWSGYKKAPIYLGCVAFFEACLLFPIPPDPMFISMGLANPKKIGIYAFITILFSILGATFAYFLGYYAIDQITPYLAHTGFNHVHNTAQKWLQTNDFWTTIIAIFVPIPYKFLGLIAGGLYMPLTSFLIVCSIKKMIRTSIVGIVMYYKGIKIDNFARLYIDIIGWAIILAILLFLLIDKALVPDKVIFNIFSPFK